MVRSVPPSLVGSGWSSFLDRYAGRNNMGYRSGWGAGESSPEPRHKALSDTQMKLDKIEIARRQLGTALALFLQDSDPVSVHTLACAGCEIAEHLTRKAGEKPFSAHALLTFPDLDIGKIRQLQNQYWNAFKHARTHDGIEREDSELLERFGDEVKRSHAVYRLARLHA